MTVLGGDGRSRGGRIEVVGFLVLLRKPEALDSRRPPQLKGHVHDHLIAGLGRSHFLFFADP